MEYAQLLQAISHTGTAPRGVVADIVQDSRKVRRGSVFVCIEGRGVDGHAYAQAALDAGAGLVVGQRPLGLANEVTVADTRMAYAVLSQAFFGHPAARLTLVGVTGTNGKTTVSTVLKQVLEALGVKCGLVGTAQNQIADLTLPAHFTTPDAFELAALMHRMVAAGCTHAVLEASSQGLHQGRLAGLRFALGIFTNLSQDHLDYHGDMGHYYEAKKLLFAQCDAALLNWDDAAGRRLMDEAAAPVKRSYSTQNNAGDFTARDVMLRADGVRFALLGEGFLLPVRFATPGAYSVQNALAAAAACIMLGFAPRQVCPALAGVPGVPGRCEVLYGGRFTVIRDFAHTADGLEKLLGALRPFAEKRLVVLFGCAGCRDAEKRPAMGQAVARYADAVWLTADNPRAEPAAQTMQDAAAPLQQKNLPLVLEEDREQAIAQALESLEEGDVLVLCGKGHEDYQALNGQTVYLDEARLVRAWLTEKGLA